MGFRKRAWLAAAVVLLLVVGRASPEYEDAVDREIDQLDDPEDSPGRYVLGKVVDALVPVASPDDAAVGGEFGDNELWRGLIGDCARSASLTCVKRSVFGYLDRSMEAARDLRLTDGLVFTRNENDVLENKYARSLNSNSSVADDDDDDDGGAGVEEENEVDGEDVEGHDEAGRSLDTFEGMTDALYDKGVRFAMTHDVQLQLPETLFGGAVLSIYPRALEEDGGALLKVEVNPARKEEAEEGRIFFKKHKEFKKKLLMSFMALLLVIKMVKVKLIYLLPLLIGVGAAKKLLLKVLLFLFPAFSHLFKFCSTYHANYAGKYHHHHHQIAHHHHHVKVPVPVPVPVPSHHTSHTVVEDSYPPSGHGGWDAGGPAWDPPSGPGHDYAGSRSELMTAAHKAEKELASWGLGHAGGDPGDTFTANYGDPASAHSLAYGAYAPLTATAAGNGDVRPARNTAHDAARPHAASPVYVATGPPQRKPQRQPDLRPQFQNLETQQQLQRQHQVQQRLQQLRVPQAQAMTARPGTTVAVTYDTFYSPILQKMDNVFVQLGFNEEACRERLVCSMYKSPARFSPHSNLISAELSRDPAELQKPSSPNSAVVRFYRYVQAARDGQDQKNCLSLYPACTVNTEVWRQ